MTRESTLAPKYGVLRVQPSPVTPRYTHRNGEREKPTITGYFGHNSDFGGSILDVVERRGKLEYMIDYDYDRSKPLPDGCYWGPITGAWDEVALD